MAIRNFYLKANIEGRETKLAGGPRGKDGGMSVVITQRNKKGIEEAVRIECFEVDGELYTGVYMNNELIGRYKTER